MFYTICDWTANLFYIPEAVYSVNYSTITCISDMLITIIHNFSMGIIPIEKTPNGNWRLLNYDEFDKSSDNFLGEYGVLT